MPTDAEWEYAARWNDGRQYPWGEEPPQCWLANFQPYRVGSYYCVGWTSPVGSYPAAPEALGLSDMSGNVWEWSNNWDPCISGPGPVFDPAGPESGEHRVARGGSWSTSDYMIDMWSAYRERLAPGGAPNNTGFRVARTLEP